MLLFRSHPWTALALVLSLGPAGACAGTLGGPGEAQEGVDPPTGIYDVTMASQGMVSEGTMTIRGVPGDYRGTLSIPGVSAEIGEVDVEGGDLQLRARTERGMLILRLLRDGDFLSGNWILGEQRGTFAAERRQASGWSG
ncbi:MAG: hypothetical protein HKN73_02490 [Gemmatimonadetes bacterium]|nr:hypothetical protein [Gemmatimonadota bacterium]